MVIRPNDPKLVAIKAELLHGIPELTGKQINSAAMLALIAINKLELGSIAGGIAESNGATRWMTDRGLLPATISP
jgi:hypothetical protein